MPGVAERPTVVSDFAVVYLTSGVMEREVDGRSWTLHAPLAYTRAPGMIERTRRVGTEPVRGVVLSVDRASFVESFGHCAGHDSRPMPTNIAIDSLLDHVSTALARRETTPTGAMDTLLKLTAERSRAQQPAVIPGR